MCVCVCIHAYLYNIMCIETLLPLTVYDVLGVVCIWRQRSRSRSPRTPPQRAESSVSSRQFKSINI